MNILSKTKFYISSKALKNVHLSKFIEECLFWINNIEYFSLNNVDELYFIINIMRIVKTTMYCSLFWGRICVSSVNVYICVCMVWLIMYVINIKICKGDQGKVDTTFIYDIFYVLCFTGHI